MNFSCGCALSRLLKLKRNFRVNLVRRINTGNALKGRAVTLDYEIVTDNNKQVDDSPIVICHGLFGNKKNWRSLSRRINTMSGRKVVTFDAVNHGLSSHHLDMSYNDLAEDLVSLLEQLNIPKAILIGHSMGGKTVMTAALEYPEITDKLIVVDAAPTLSKSMGEVTSYMKAMYNMDMSTMKKRQDVENELKKFVKSTSVMQFLMSNLVSSKEGLSWRINLDAMMRNYHYTHDFPKFDEDVIYNGPTLFVGGGRSYYITENEYPVIYHRFPAAEIKHVADAGHWVHSEKPNEFLNCISDYVCV